MKTYLSCKLAEVSRWMIESYTAVQNRCLSLIELECLTACHVDEMERIVSSSDSGQGSEVIAAEPSHTPKILQAGSQQTEMPVLSSSSNRLAS